MRVVRPNRTRELSDAPASRRIAGANDDSRLRSMPPERRPRARSDAIHRDLQRLFQNSFRRGRRNHMKQRQIRAELLGEHACAIDRSFALRQ